jgi:mitogen-activated protein kinase organizer 1
VNSVKFNEYGAAIISAGYDRTVRAWDCRSHSTEPIQVIDTFADSVMSVCLTKTEILAGCVDGTIRTFDIRIGREIVDNLGQSVNCISISNDNNCILASCLDSKLRLLDRSTGELLQEYKGHVCKMRMLFVVPRMGAYFFGIWWRVQLFHHSELMHQW